MILRPGDSYSRRRFSGECNSAEEFSDTSCCGGGIGSPAAVKTLPGIGVRELRRNAQKALKISLIGESGGIVWADPERAQVIFMCGVVIPEPIAADTQLKKGDIAVTVQLDESAAQDIRLLSGGRFIPENGRPVFLLFHHQPSNFTADFSPRGIVGQGAE